MILNRPVLRWHGGKWRLAPWIISHFPEHRIYTEVYGGAASVLIRKPKCYSEVYNDLNGDVVNLFRVLQDNQLSARLVGMLRLTPFAREEFELSYQPIADPLERARRIVITSFMGFGSSSATRTAKTGFRANSNRSGTTPAHDWGNYPDSLLAIIERLRGVCIENKPALEVLLQHDADDCLHYVDPPYVHSTRKPGNENNYTHEMTDPDHIELARTLKALAGKVIVSGYHSSLYDGLYDGWHRVEIDALADGAKERVEVLWINDAAWETNQGKLL